MMQYQPSGKLNAQPVLSVRQNVVEAEETHIGNSYPV